MDNTKQFNLQYTDCHCNGNHNQHMHHICMDRYTMVLGPHSHDGLPMHCHDPRPHHCNLPHSHVRPSKPFRKPINDSICKCQHSCHSRLPFKESYGHIHDLDGSIIRITDFDYLLDTHFDGHCFDTCVKPLHQQVCHDFICPWSPYDEIATNHIHACHKHNMSINTEEVSRTTNIKDNHGNIRFVVSLSPLDECMPCNEAHFSNKQYAVDVISYCYNKTPIFIVHDEFTNIEESTLAYEKYVHQYELIACTNVIQCQDIYAFADKINYKQVDKCCANCKWSMEIDSDDKLFDEIVDCGCTCNGHHHNACDMHSKKLVCTNIDIFGLSDLHNHVGKHISVQLYPEVNANHVCDLHCDERADGFHHPHIHHEYDEDGLKLPFHHTSKGRIL